MNMKISWKQIEQEGTWKTRQGGDKILPLLETRNSGGNDGNRQHTKKVNKRSTPKKEKERKRKRREEKRKRENARRQTMDPATIKKVGLEWRWKVLPLHSNSVATFHKGAITAASADRTPRDSNGWISIAHSKPSFSLKMQPPQDQRNPLIIQVPASQRCVIYESPRSLFVLQIHKFFYRFKC